MSKCKDCQKYNTCSTREVFGSLSCNDGFVIKKQTNAMRIRSMNDEELARILFSLPYDEISKTKTSTHAGIDLLDVIEWLQSEVSE